jgi:FkbM family methyltransferase
MSALNNLGTFLHNPLVRKRYLKWLTYKHVAGRPPYVVLPKGHKVLPAPRFNDYHAIATQHPGEPEFVLLDSLLASTDNGIFIDVGANVGTMSVLAHSTGRTSRIVALEPNHRYCATWHMNMSLNGIDNATLIQAAAGDACADVGFRVDPAFPLNGKIDLGAIYSTPMTIKVKMITIDALCEMLNICDVALLEIDTEGAEPIVIRGASKLLKERRVRCILMEFIVEFIEDIAEDPYMFVNEIQEWGYTLYGIEPDGTLGKRLDGGTLVDERRVPAEAPMRPFNEINLVAVLQD